VPFQSEKTNLTFNANRSGTYSKSFYRSSTKSSSAQKKEFERSRLLSRNRLTTPFIRPPNSSLKPSIGVGNGNLPDRVLRISRDI
jgi:hypothetical protein